jgi:polypyrimidine tract-binding protein 2
VLHFRNVTSEINQEDIMEMAAPFGTVEKVVMLTSKNQALLEFADISAAISMSNFYINTQPNIRGRKVYMRFSRHQQLTASAAGPNRILLVTLQTEQEPVIPITADIVWQIFSSYGFIEKIVVMNRQSQEYAEESRRDSRLQTLVQFSSPASAQTASQYLNGKTVYVGTDPIMSITLFIQYSHLTQLTVKHNSASARDYITPLPWGHQYHHQQPAPYQQQQQQPYGAPGYGYPPMPMPMPGMHGHGMPPPHHHGGGYM